VSFLHQLRPMITRCSLLVLLSGSACNVWSSHSPTDREAAAAARARLVEHLRAEGIRDERTLAAVMRVPREEFVLPRDRGHAYVDEALPIASGQTISQPYIVALMTELLELKGDERVLEVGTGSGYQAAVLSHLAKQVYSIEIDPGLAATARQRLQDLGYANVTVRAGDGFYGWPEQAPFDAIIITAVAPRVPAPLLDQLKPGGRLVMPLDEGDRQTLVRARVQDGGLQIERIAGVAFVPMTGAIRIVPPASGSRSGTPEQ
jgi:protein-L-isoaspartate(D-aspartate) O-methyltransferase